MHLTTLEPSSSPPETTPQERPPGHVPALTDIAIVGLGYVGLPLSLQFAGSGVDVLGLDIDPEKVEMLNAGKSYIRHIPEEAIANELKTSRFEATDRLRPCTGGASRHHLCPNASSKNREPDISYILETGRGSPRTCKRNARRFGVNNLPRYDRRGSACSSRSRVRFEGRTRFSSGLFPRARGSRESR